MLFLSFQKLILTWAKLQKTSEICKKYVSQIAQIGEFAPSFDQFAPMKNTLLKMYPSSDEFRLGSLRKTLYFCSVRFK